MAVTVVPCGATYTPSGPRHTTTRIACDVRTGPSGRAAMRALAPPPGGGLLGELETAGGGAEADGDDDEAPLDAGLPGPGRLDVGALAPEALIACSR